MRWLLAVVLIFAAFVFADLASSVDSECEYRGEQQKPANGPEKHEGLTCSFAYRAMTASVDFIEERHEFVTAGSTVVIAVFTVILGVFTISLSRSTRIAAEAARDAANADIEADRAHLFTIIDRETLSEVIPRASVYVNSPDMDDGTVSHLQVAFFFENFGRTPAVVKELRYDLIKGDDFVEGQKAPLREDDDTVNQVIAAGKPTDSIFVPKSGMSLILRDVKAIASGKASLIFYGSVVYSDVFERHIEREFKWHYAGNGLRMDYQRETIKSEA